MDTLNIDLKQAILTVLHDYREFLGQDPETESQVVIDETHNHYLLIEIGWDQSRRIYGTLIHIDCHSSFVIRHLSFVICHSSFVTEQGTDNFLITL